MSAEPITPDAFADRLAALRGPGRLIAALAGPPGGGKSTAAARVADRLNAAAPGVCVVIPMDGFHFDDAVLTARGRLPFKGAPDTFDVGGLRALLARLRADAEDEIAYPLFDRALEISRNAAAVAPRAARVVLVEGNWLLLRAAPWAELRGLFDVTAMAACDAPTLRRRLVARWRAAGCDDAEIARRVDGNDLPNARAVLADSAPADLSVATSD